MSRWRSTVESRLSQVRIARAEEKPRARKAKANARPKMWRAQSVVERITPQMSARSSMEGADTLESIVTKK